MSVVEIKGVPPETVVIAEGDEVRLRTAVTTELNGRSYTGQKVVVLKLERIERGLVHFRLGEEPFPFAGQFTEAAIADLERQAAQLQLLARHMYDVAENARSTSKVINAEIAQDLEARRRP